MKKRLLSAILAAGVIGGTATTAKAESLLLPYFSTKGGNDTIISLAESAGIDWAMDITFMYKDLSKPADYCTHFNVIVPFTGFDLTSIWASTGQSVFGDNYSAPAGIGTGYEGYVVVTDYAEYDDFFRGEGIVINLGTGLYLDQPLYRLGAMQVFDYDTYIGQPSMNNSSGYLGETAELENPAQLMFYPFNIANTALYVIGNIDNLADDTSQARVGIENWYAFGGFTGFTSGVVFDRSENPYSGRQRPVVVCAALLPLSSMLIEPQLNAVKNTGGHTAVIPFTPSNDNIGRTVETSEAMLWKVEISNISNFRAMTVYPLRTYTPSDVWGNWWVMNFNTKMSEKQ